MLTINTDLYNDGDTFVPRSIVDPINERYIVNSIIFNYNELKSSIKNQIDYRGFINSDTIINHDNHRGRYLIYDYYKQIQLFGPSSYYYYDNPTVFSLFGDLNQIGFPINSCKSYLFDSDLNECFIPESRSNSSNYKYGVILNYDDNIISAVRDDAGDYTYNNIYYLFNNDSLIYINQGGDRLYQIKLEDSDISISYLFKLDSDDNLSIINIPDDYSYITYTRQADHEHLLVYQYSIASEDNSELFNIASDVYGDSEIVNLNSANYGTFKNYYQDESVLKTAYGWFFKHHDDDLDSDFYKIRLFSIDFTNYDNSDIDYSVTEFNLNWFDYKHYLTFPDIDFNISGIDLNITPYLKNINDSKYLFIIVRYAIHSDDLFDAVNLKTRRNILIYSFKYNEDSDAYDYISHNIFNNRYYSDICIDELFGLNDMFVLTETLLNDIYFSPLVFNGIEWEINRTIRSKLNVLRVKDHLFYVDQNNDLRVEKYIARPKIYVRFEKENYTYINSDITTKIYVRSSYYLSDVASRIRVTIASDNAELLNCCNHCKSFEVEMYNGEYPLDLLITNTGDVRIDATLIGMYSLKDGLQREFSRTLQIKFDHKLERVWE